MEKLISFLVAFSLSISIFSQNIILVDGPSGSSTHNTLADAVAAAEPNDKIYLSGGVHPFASAVINKPLHIIGAGYNPDSTIATMPTILNGAITLNEGSENSFLTGFKISTLTFGSGADTLSNISISRCEIDNVTASASNKLDDILFHECILGHLSGKYSNFETNNIIFDKCIFHGTITNFNGGVTIKNGVMLHVGGSDDYLLARVYWCVFENCIITQSPSLYLNVYGNNGTGANYFYNCILTISEFPSGGVASESNNIFSISADSIFISYDGGTEFSHSYDFHLMEDSPGTAAGTDGFDIGLYGTNSPFKEGGVPYNPHIRLKNIATETDANGNLHVVIKVAAQDN